MHIGSWKLQKRLSMADGFIMLFLVYILMNGIVGSGLLPVKWLAGFLPGGATVINLMMVQLIFHTPLMVEMWCCFCVCAVFRQQRLVFGR